MLTTTQVICLSEFIKPQNMPVHHHRRHRHRHSSSSSSSADSSNVNINPSTAKNHSNQSKLVINSKSKKKNHKDQINQINSSPSSPSSTQSINQSSSIKPINSNFYQQANHESSPGSHSTQFTNSKSLQTPDLDQNFINQNLNLTNGQLKQRNIASKHLKNKKSKRNQSETESDESNSIFQSNQNHQIKSNQLNSSKSIINNHTPNHHHHPQKPTPKRPRLENKSSKNNQTHKSTAPPQLFFTTQRFKTPAKLDTSITTIPEQTHHSSSGHKSKVKGKAKEIDQNLIIDKLTNQTHNSSYNHIPLSPARSPSKSHYQKNPHIYGHQDLQLDGEISIIGAETPKNTKNKHYRSLGSTKKKDKRLELGHEPTLLTNSLQKFESTSSLGSGGRARRGSRASSIGSGHEALPHPRIPPTMLHRHIRTDLPPSIRCRTLLSWCSQKAEHVTYSILYPNFKPTRFIPEELSKPLSDSLSRLTISYPPTTNSKLVNKAVKMALKNYVRGICESEVEVSWGIPDSEISIEDQEEASILDLESLPPHPQDLKNERKIKELDNWRIRMSYEDSARQSQLSRYGSLIERLVADPIEGLDRSTRFQETDIPNIDTKKLHDRISIIELGRFLRSHSGSIPKSIDASEIHGKDWSELPLNIGTVAEEMNRVKERVRRIEEKIKRLQDSSTKKLKELEEGEELSLIESKLMISSNDNHQLDICLKSLNLNLHDSNQVEGIGKRDFLRSLSRCQED
ncbi:hypothetical protein O181_004019 [Austropuccinia psidii MF-1]|uniref:Kinetochore protein mis13 n=1 Tax=Austropuccinia psidii MF-1 TaxID=1389203 RepID=A0A9Q3GEF1_9BASI|nr:hypothetical protein [Austropuccinia psidii MF-1]